jgi:flagellar protein FliO/FliZ
MAVFVNFRAVIINIPETTRVFLANVNADVEKAADVGGGMVPWGLWFDLIWRLGAFALVVGLAFFVTRFLAKAQFSRKSTANLRVVEAASVAPQSTVQLVKAGERLFLLGVTRERITFLAEINDDDLTAGTGQNEHEEVFKTPVPLEKYLKIFRRDKKDTTDGD